MALIDGEYIGLNGQKIAAFYDTVTGQFFQKTVLALADGSPVGGEDLGSGVAILISAVGKQEVRGTMAEGATISTEPPVYVGGYAMTSRISPTPLTDGKFHAFRLTADGALVTAPYTNHENLVSAVASTTGTSAEIIPAGPSGVRTYLTWIHLVNTSATPVTVQLKDGNTVMDTFYLGATSGMPPVTYPTPLRGTAATAWNFAPSSGVTTVTCSAGGYQSKV